MIIFLDFDGVISSPRAYVTQCDQEDFYLRWLDPIACKFLRRICEQFGAQFVISSTWRKFGFQSCVEQSLGYYGLDKFVHEDWCTDDLWTREVDSLDSRPMEIDAWLKKNSPTDYIILDDDSFRWTEHQKARWVRTSCADGLLLAQMDDIIHRMEQATGIEFNKWEEGR